MTHAPFSIPDPRKQIPFSNLSGLITLDADTANALAEFKCSKRHRNALGCLSFTQGSALGSVSQRGNDGGHSAHGAMRRIPRWNSVHMPKIRFFPALRSSHPLFQRPSPQKQIPTT